MTQKDFEIMVDNTINRLRSKMELKGNEYARGDNRLSNFKQAAGIRRGETPEGSLLGMLTKHWVSISDLVEDLKEGKVTTIELWREKLGDNIIYSLLLEACAIDRLGISVAENATSNIVSTMPEEIIEQLRNISELLDEIDPVTKELIRGSIEICLRRLERNDG